MVKPNLEAFNNRPDLVFVIDRFNYIEQTITEIIATYVAAPKQKNEFVRTVLLNNSIVSFGSKIKLFVHLNSIENWAKINGNDLHRIAHIRNQFAHSGKPWIEIRIGDQEPLETDIYLMLESVTGSGKLVKVKADDALQEFTELFVVLKEQLNSIRYDQESS